MIQRNKAARPIQPKRNPQQANVKRPAAPHVYRPQPVPKCLQAKMSGSQRPAPQARQTPQAPPPYRPQPTPRVLQPKKPNVQPPVNQPRPAPVAPPVYRPQPVPKVLQSKRAQTPGGAAQPGHEAQPSQRRPGAPTHTRPPTPLESLRARLPGPGVTHAKSRPMIKAGAVQRSVIQALWLSDGTTGVWKRGKGDAQDGTYQHVGDHMFRRIIPGSNSNSSSNSSSDSLDNELYRWSPAEDKLQSLPLTKRMLEALQAGRYDQAVTFERAIANEHESTNLTLYGLQTNPGRYIEYNMKTGKAVFMDQEQATSTPINQPVNPHSPFMEHNGEKFFRMTSAQTGLEETGIILFYLKDQASNAAPTKKDVKESPTKIDAGSEKVMEDYITAENILLWEPIKTRSMSQKSVMNNVTAAEEAASLGMDSGNWQWLHLIAHSMGALGNPQVPRNLVAGTAASNGAMAFLEKGIKEYVKETEQSVRVRVIAHLIPPTHVASSIKYEVENALVGGKAIFYFDPLNPNKAAIQHADHYATVLIDKLGKGPQRPGTPERAELLRTITGKQHFSTPERLESEPSQSSPFISPNSMGSLFNPSSHPIPPQISPLTSPASSPSPSLTPPSSSVPSNSNQDYQHIAQAIAQGHVTVGRGSKEHKKNETPQ